MYFQCIVVQFQSKAEKLKDFFCAFLNTKLKSLVDILNGAEANILKFQNAIRVANNNLTKFWESNLDSASQIKLSILQNEFLYVLKLEESISVFEHTLIQSTLRYSINEELNSFLVRFKNDLTDGVLKQIKPVTSAGIKAVNSLDSLKDKNLVTYLELDFSRFQPDKALLNIELKPSASLSSNSLLAIKSLDENLIEIHEKLHKQVEELKNLLISQKPIKDYQKLLEKTNSTLDEDFDGYFTAISAYRTSVFSHGVKAAITTLGLGQKMDDLEFDSPTDDEKLSIKQEAQARIFPKSFEVLNQDLDKLADLDRRTEELRQKLKLLNTEKSIKRDTSLDDWKESQLKSISGDLVDKVEVDVRKFQGSINIKIQQLVGKYNERWNADVKTLRKDRSKRLFKSILFSSIIVSTFYILVIYGAKIEVANNLFVYVTGALVSNFVSTFLTWQFNKLTDKFPLNINKKESELITDLRLEYNQLIDESNSDLRNMLDFDKQLLSRFWQDLLIEKPRENWECKRADFYIQLRSCINEYSAIYAEYIQIVEETSRKASAYFSNTEENLKKLNDFSSELQQKSIQPSFDLLANTRRNLENVIAGIQEIDFS
jgi:hypothetical protein